MFLGYLLCFGTGVDDHVEVGGSLVVVVQSRVAFDRKVGHIRTHPRLVSEFSFKSIVLLNLFCIEVCAVGSVIPCDVWP